MERMKDFTKTHDTLLAICNWLLDDAHADLAVATERAGRYLARYYGLRSIGSEGPARVVLRGRGGNGELLTAHLRLPCTGAEIGQAIDRLVEACDRQFTRERERKQVLVFATAPDRESGGLLRDVVLSTLTEMFACWDAPEVVILSGGADAAIVVDINDRRRKADEDEILALVASWREKLAAPSLDPTADWGPPEDEEEHGEPLDVWGMT
jgi:hypothetical protein